MSQQKPWPWPKASDFTGPWPWPKSPEPTLHERVVGAAEDWAEAPTLADEE